MAKKTKSIYNKNIYMNCGTLCFSLILILSLVCRVKVPKVEDLLVEEWGLARPNQAGLSAWTLNTYIRQKNNLRLYKLNAVHNFTVHRVYSYCSLLYWDYFFVTLIHFPPNRYFICKFFYRNVHNTNLGLVYLN